jgi:TetR/AcrR family transcriptional regulator of autoinduction and epiphytic fitness
MARPASDLRARVIAAARVVFLAHGVDAAPLREIARQARTNLGMIYYYFPTKDDLFAEVIEAPYARIVDDLAAALAGDRPVRDRICDVYRRLCAMTADEREIGALVAREVLMSKPRRARMFERFLRGHIPLVLAALEGGKARGELRAEVPTPLLLSMTAGVGLFPQIAIHVLGMPGMPPAEGLAELLTARLFDGIAAR